MPRSVGLAFCGSVEHGAERFTAICTDFVVGEVKVNFFAVANVDKLLASVVGEGELYVVEVLLARA